MDALQAIVGERRTYSTVNCSHDHPFAQLILPLTGTLFIETQIHHLALDEASVFFLPSGCLHHFYARDTNEFLILDIPHHLMLGFAAGSTSQGIRVDFEDRWRAIRTLLLAELDRQAATATDSPSLPMDAILHLVHYIRSILVQPHVSPSLQHIHQHYHTRINVAHLAQIEGYTPAYYSEWFKAQTGKSPKTYIQDLRLKQAKDLLQWSDLPIHQIATQVGFEQASSLTRLFQRREATTPQRYRSEIRNAANTSLKFG
ncbi:MAG: AraC family transcriptional regulator [Cyanobacteria bacterium P01_F01_bin.86]